MHLPNGSQIFVESNRGSAIEATAVSNAKDPVFTANPIWNTSASA